MNNLKKPRERVNDRDTLRSAAKSLAARLIYSELTHSEWLQERDKTIHSLDAWTRVPYYVHTEIFGYLHGVIDSLYNSGLIVWCHCDENGQLVPANSREWDYSKIDTNKSRHCWRSSLKVWFES